MQESSGRVSGRTPTARYQFPAFRLGSVLPQTSRIILYKPSPDPIEFLLIVSGFDQTDPVRKQAGVQESSGPLLASASQPIRPGCESDPACLLGLHSAFGTSTEVVYLQRCLVVTWLVPRGPAPISAHVLCTPYDHTPGCNVVRSHISRVHVFGCNHHHVWQNDRDL